MFDNGLGSISVTPSGKIGVGIGNDLTIIPESGTIGFGDDGVTFDPTEGIRENEEHYKRSQELEDRRRLRRRNGRWE